MQIRFHSLRRVSKLILFEIEYARFYPTNYLHDCRVVAPFSSAIRKKLQEIVSTSAKQLLLSASITQWTQQNAAMRILCWKFRIYEVLDATHHYQTSMKSSEDGSDRIIKCIFDLSIHPQTDSWHWDWLKYYSIIRRSSSRVDLHRTNSALGHRMWLICE